MSLFYRIIKEQWQAIIIALILVLISFELISYVLLVPEEDWVKTKGSVFQIINNTKELWNNFTNYNETVYKGRSYYYQEKCIEECTIIYQIQIDEKKEFYNRWNHPEGFSKIGNTNTDMRIEKTPQGRLIILYDTSGNIKEKMQCRETCKMEKFEYKPLDFSNFFVKNE